jgi:uncharacterized protein YcbX
VVAPGVGESGFVENDWVKKELWIGEACIRVTFPVSRCIMTTLAQGDLPGDPGILRTAAAHNRLPVGSLGTLPCAGVGGVVKTPGRARREDPVRIRRD